MGIVNDMGNLRDVDMDYVAPEFTHIIYEQNDPFKKGKGSDDALRRVLQTTLYHPERKEETIIDRCLKKFI